MERSELAAVIDELRERTARTLLEYRLAGKTDEAAFGERAELAMVEVAALLEQPAVRLGSPPGWIDRGIAHWDGCWREPGHHACAIALLEQPEAREPEAQLATEILAELVRARTKFPGDNVTTLALVEEVGELAKATFEESRARVRKEAVQVATMAMRVVLDGDQTLDAWRASKGLDALVGAAPERSAEQ